MAISEKTTRVNGHNVHYWEDGTQHGKPVILLHGGFGDAWVQWKEVIPLLAEEYHVIAPDLPGYSQSDALPTVRVNRLVEWLKGVLDTLEIDQSVLIGHSFAGLIARLLTAEMPQRFPALLLVNGGVIPAAPLLAKTVARVPGLGKLVFNRVASSTTTNSELARIFQNQDTLTSEFVARVQQNRDGLARLMQGLTVSAIPQERTPLVPVCLLWGEEDPVTPVWAAENIKKGIPGARLNLIAGCGHLPHVEAPDVFATQVSFFLNNLDRVQRDLPGVGLLKPRAL